MTNSCFSPLGLIALVVAATPAFAEAQKPDAPKPAPAKPDDAVEMPTLYVGDAAPALAIAKWIAGAPVEKLEKGKVYLVSTWGSSTLLVDDVLAPLTQLQTEKGAAGLTVIATACDGTKPGSASLEKYAKEHAAEIGFALGYEKESLVDKTWREAAKQVFAPNHFLVDKGGKIAWIGNLENLEPTLGEVLAGKHDLAKAAKEYKDAIQLDLRTRKYRIAHSGAEINERWDKVAENAKKLVELEPVRMGGYAYSAMIALGVRLQKPDEAYAFAKAFVDGPGKDSRDGLNAIAWAIVDPGEHVEPRDLALAQRAAKRAVELTKEQDAGIMDTLAMALFHQGKLDDALAWAKKCAKLDESFAERVKWFEDERAKAKE